MEFIQEELAMRYASPHIFFTLACAPLLLTLGLSRVQAQEITDNVDLGSLESLTYTRIEGGKRQSGPTHLGVEILPLDAQQRLNQLGETRPDEGNSSRVRDLVARLRKMQANYTIAGKLDEAFILRERIEEFLAGRAGVEPDPGNLTGYRNQVGKTHVFHVTGHLTGSVWGSQIYTDDSDLGAAAVHSGLLREGQTGVVKVTILPGQDHYDGAASNGITSSSYETWQGSYSIAPAAFHVGAHDDTTMPDEAQKLEDALTTTAEKVSAGQLWQGMDRLQKMQETAQRAQKLDQALALRDGIRTLIIKLVGAQQDPGTLGSLRGQIGKSFYFVVTGSANSSIWGSEVYTDDSKLSTVAVHAGLLREGQRGIVKVTIRPGYEEYGGSDSNGVVSEAYGPWQGSYQVSAFRMPARPRLTAP